MSQKVQIIRHIEVVVYTALSFILGAAAIHCFRQLTGWTDTEWSQISQICVYAGVVAAFGSLFCKIYDKVERMLQAAVDRRCRKRKRSVIVNFPTVG